MKILSIETDDALISLLTRTLSAQHHIVDAVKDGEMGWTYASTFEYDAIVLEIVLPKLDGITLCKRLRGEGYAMPILFLTAQDSIDAKIQALDAGADDYVVKPFNMNELMARMRALFRRSNNHPLPLLSWGDLAIDPSTCEVTYNGQPLDLTTKEYDLLELFVRNSYKVFSSEEIIDRLWSSDDFPAEATVRSHLRRLRRKLQAAGAPPDAIGTIHGRGYYLKSPQTDATIGLSLAGDIATLKAADRSVQVSQQQQDRSFLHNNWVTTKPQYLQTLTELTAIVDRLLVGNCEDAERLAAHQQAGELVSALGGFGLMSAMEIARQIETLLDRSTRLTLPEIAILPPLLAELATEIDCHAPSPNRSRLLFVDLDPSLTLPLRKLAADRDIHTLVLANLAAADTYLATIPDPPSDLLAATVVLVSLAQDGESTALLAFLHNVHQRFPQWSVLVLAQHDSLNARLAVVRNRGRFLSIAGLSLERIFAATISLLQPAAALVKVMVVDDDLDWLRSLPKLLQSWGLKVTTLAERQQFWTVLQSVQPDALILELNMPEINGWELCQVIRSDPLWQHLPILCLSKIHDPIGQQQAFSVGADDYLCKPIVGGELAWRIRHRLARLQARQTVP